MGTLAEVYRTLRNYPRMAYLIGDEASPREARNMKYHT